MSARRLALAVPFTLLLPLAAQSTHPFDAPVVVPLTAPPGQVEDMELLGDIDNDGDVDVLAFTRVNNNLGRTSFRPLRNDGFGNLVPGPAVSIAPDVSSLMCMADVDADGFLDVITKSALNPAGPGLLVFRSLGGTGWAAPLHVPLPGLAWVLGTGHANGDGVADVFVLHSAGGLNLAARWLLGGPAATFPVGPTVAFGTSSTFDGALLDLDGDGLTDFAALTDTSPGQTIGLYLTTAAGLVLSSTLPLTATGGANILAADMDGDGDTDLQTAWHLSSSTHYRLLRNDGPAGVTALASHAVASSLVFGLRAVDWDGDGDQDLLARDGGVGGGGPVGYGITLLENVGGVFTPRRRDSFPENSMVLGAGAADLDGDGHADYIEPHTLVFGSGAFVLPPAVAIEFPDDWDGDGDLDDTGRTNDGRGVLTAIAGFMPPPPANHAYRAFVATADFDGDGLREVIAPLHQAVFPGAFVEMRRLEANGDGRLVDVGVTPVTGGLVTDVDGDGDVDVFSGQGIWQNDGSGAFTLVPFAVAGFLPSATGDLDNDSDQDFVGTIGQQTVVLLRTGPSAFATTTLAVPAGVLAMVIAPTPLSDLDDDGDLDILCTAVTGTLAQLTVVFANTGGAFTALPLLPLGGRLLPGDVDGDGMTDLCVQEPQRLHVLRRVGPGITFGPPATYVWGAARVAADLDQDGDLDLLGTPTLPNHRFVKPTAGERRQYGTGGAGSGGRRPLLSLLGPLRAGLTTASRVVAAPGGSIGVLFVSTVEANVPNALPGVTSWIGPSFPALVATLGGAQGQPGAGSVDIPIVIPPGANGAQLFLQFVVLDPIGPIGLGYSNGCELLVGL